MGCISSSVKAAKVEDNYQVPAENNNNINNNSTDSNNNKTTTEEKKVVLETHNNNNNNKSKPSKSDGVLPTKSKANPSKSNPKDDSDWTPTIDTDIFNEKGGGRLTTTAVDKNANEQILV